MRDAETRVFIVDDEEPVRDSIGLLLRSVGLRSQGFPDARAFLEAYCPEQPGCLVLDIRMPRMSGLELQQELNRRGWGIPVIFITGHGDVPMAVEAMRAGAVDFLQKPFKDDELIRRVQKALDQDERLREQLSGLEQVRARFEGLTPREREIARRLVAGAANKVIAIELALSERTVELHRAHIMQKMEARGLAQLVQMLMRLQPA
ncbi:MAG: response regulator [Gammaproteobacteria bacterium]|uniref:response regulator transcription factor n=1 Tax=Nevskia sp. TaxID=1929292 RepID=UPI003F71617B|nr:response regulator [Gammaproteobacteria bacterium]